MALSADSRQVSMTPAAKRILDDLVAGHDLIREGIHAYCGPRRVASRTVTALVWAAAIREVAPSDGPGSRYYEIAPMGRRYLRRPELEQEYYEAVRLQKGPFTIDENDRIVPLKQD
jgi:hypothetical protein